SAFDWHWRSESIALAKATRPVQHQGGLCWGSSAAGNQETLPIRVHVKTKKTRFWQEERMWISEVEVGPKLHSYRHQLAVICHVEHFLAIGAPARHGTATTRNQGLFS